MNRPATPKPVARPRRSLVACLPHPLVLVLAAALWATAAPGPFAGTPHCPGSAPAPPVGERSRSGCVMPAVAHRVAATASKATEAGAMGPGTTGIGAAVLGVAGLERGRPPEAAIVWRRSRAVGLPNRGRLRGGVELPAAGTHFVTVDPVAGAGRNRAWRRHGTDRLVDLLLRVAADYAAAYPEAPRLVVGDLSRPRGGRFGPELGGDGHRSHQNGLDADVFYPRRDGLERIPRRVGQVDRHLAQELVDRFVRAGAEYVFVGPLTGLRGPPKVVMVLGNHDDHLHVRIRPASRARQ